MAYGRLVCDPRGVLTTTGATDVLVYRRAAAPRFVLTSPPAAGVSGELVLDDEPAVRDALAAGLRRIAGDAPRPICGGYRARAAAIVAVDDEVIVVLGRRDGCLAGVSDKVLAAAAAAAAAPSAGA